MRDKGGIIAEKCRLMKELGEKRERKIRALEAFVDHAITKDELQLLNEWCDSRIACLTAQLADIEMRQMWDEAAAEITDAIRGIMIGERAAEEVYARMLHHMTVDGDGRVEVVLEQIPARWVFQML